LSIREKLLDFGFNQYNRAFYEMVGYVNNVEVLLLKSLICNSPEKTAQTMQEMETVKSCPKQFCCPIHRNSSHRWEIWLIP